MIEQSEGGPRISMDTILTDYDAEHYQKINEARER